MTQSPKILNPKRKEKLSDKEQSERFKEAAHALDANQSDRFEQSLHAILRPMKPNRLE